MHPILSGSMFSLVYPRVPEAMLRRRYDLATTKHAAICSQVEVNTIMVNCYSITPKMAARKHGPPTRARHLFMSGDFIVARGYDLFSKSNEWTKQLYTVSVKVHGTAVFISALLEQRLLIIAMNGNQLSPSHAARAHMHLANQLQKKNSTSSHLSQFLYKHNLTALAHLCDDSFEENVLANSESGLFVHGLNFNTPKLHTVPSPQVVIFAKQFGFGMPKTRRFPEPRCLDIFLTATGHHGCENGTPIEGFVVRGEDDSFQVVLMKSPYPIFHQFRQMTRVLIIQREWDVMHLFRPVYREYLNFAAMWLQNGSRRKDYLEGHGVIELREAFLGHLRERFFGESLLVKLLVCSQDVGMKTIVLVPLQPWGSVFTPFKPLFMTWKFIQSNHFLRDVAAQSVPEIGSFPVVVIDSPSQTVEDRDHIARLVLKQPHSVPVIVVAVHLTMARPSYFEPFDKKHEPLFDAYLEAPEGQDLFYVFSWMNKVFPETVPWIPTVRSLVNGILN